MSDRKQPGCQGALAGLIPIEVAPAARNLIWVISSAAPRSLTTRIAILNATRP
ncbi:MAG: hypothetical protein U0074_05105 [Kouleothrix sp.]